MTLDIETAKKILEDVDKKHVFALKRGHEIKSLAELFEELKTISDEEFKHHVTEEKNDFAQWVEDVIGDKHLAETMREVKDKEKTLDKVKSRLFILKLLTVLKEDITGEKIKDEKIEDFVEHEIKEIEAEERKEAKETEHHLPRHDISNLKDEREALTEIRSYVEEMEKNEERIVEELANLESENKSLEKLFSRNFLHGFLLGMSCGILIVIIGLKVILMASP